MPNNSDNYIRCPAARKYACDAVLTQTLWQAADPVQSETRNNDSMYIRRKATNTGCCTNNSLTTRYACKYSHYCRAMMQCKQIANIVQVKHW